MHNYIANAVLDHWTAFSIVVNKYMTVLAIIPRTHGTGYLPRAIIDQQAHFT